MVLKKITAITCVLFAQWGEQNNMYCRKSANAGKLALPGLQIYGWPGPLSPDFIIWPITFKGSEPSGPIIFSCEKSHFKKNIHFTASQQKVHVGCQYSKTCLKQPLKKDKRSL